VGDIFKGAPFAGIYGMPQGFRRYTGSDLANTQVLEL
jgi:hypothetical protein